MRGILNPYNRIFIPYLFISILGILNIYSVSRSFGDYLFYRHITYFFLGLVVFIFLSRVKLPEWKEFSYIFFSISIFLLLFVLLKEKGIKRWLFIGNFSFQVSDACKPLLIYFLSMVFSLNKKRGYIDSFKLLFLHILPFFLILIEPDLGSAFFYIFLFAFYLIFSSFNIRVKLFYIFAFLSLIFSLNFFAFFIFSSLLLLFIIIFSKFPMGDKILLTFSVLIPGLTVPFIYNNLLKEYQRKRIRHFLNPSEDPKGAGWQILQGKLAIGSGGILGKGFLKGSHKSLAFLPQAHSDFAFASFAEEFGFIGSSILILLYFSLLSGILNILKEKEGFSYFFILGIFASIFYSFLVNIGGVIGFLPVTGIPLPFFSYGGTNFVIHSLLLGLVLSFLR
ncbi:MAG: rod shape-determining protein RodA [candidate division WOR-3 bacterium]